MQSILSNILNHYNLPPCISHTQIRHGLMNETYRVRTADSAEYIVQRLHSKVDGEGAAHDAAAVTEMLRGVGIAAPTFLKNRHSAYIHVGQSNGDGAVRECWRIQTCIAGVTHTHVSSAAMAHDAGQALGRMHRALLPCMHVFTPKYEPHDTVRVCEIFTKYVYADAFTGSGAAANVASLTYIVDTLPSLLLPPLPQRVIHNDPKIGNLIFASTGEAVTFVDFDSVGCGSLLLDIGDALRSWCKVRDIFNKLHFSNEYAKAAVAGYMQHMGEHLTPFEVEHIPQAVKLISLELAARFYIDSIEQTHFAWDAEKYISHAAHSIARAEEMGRYAQNNTFSEMYF